MKITPKINFEYEQVLDKKTQGLIRAACSVALACPDCLRNAVKVANEGGASAAELREAVALALLVSGGRARNFAVGFEAELGFK